MSSNESLVHFRAVRFLYEAGYKLRITSVPIATSAVIYHQFFKDNSLREYDPYLIATTALYLAGKIEEEPVKIRDVVNVSYRTLHKSKSPLDVGDTFWALRESVANCELFLLRMLKFKVVYSHPHKYLLHYLKLLKDWFEAYEWDRLPITRTSWSLLRDSYLGNACMKYKPQHTAVSIIYLALQCHGVEVPHHKHADTKWWQVFSEDITLKDIENICTDIIHTYDIESLAQTG